MPSLRIGVVQMAPELGKVGKNLQKLSKITANLKPGTLDLLCLPEMILTGYTFKCADAIKPFLEKPDQGVTSRYCKELASQLGCHVIAGYPEILANENESHEIEVQDENNHHETGLVGYNSAILYGPNGLCGNYRKTNLFDTDKPWAFPGTGFATFGLGQSLGRVSLGICMDLNPFPGAVWTTDNAPYELAQYVIDENTNLLVVLCAWLDSNKDPDSRWDISTLNYWIARLRPLWKTLETSSPKHSDTIVVMCNRSGVEGETRFAGTSAIFRFSQNAEHPEIIGVMTREQEGVQIWDV